MNYLVQGMEDKRKIELLISCTSLDSEAMQGAFIDHFCRDMSKTDAALINNVKLPNLSRDIKILNVVAEKFERLKELDWPEYQALKDNKKAAK